MCTHTHTLATPRPLLRRRGQEDGTKDHISGKHFDSDERERVKHVHVFARPSARSGARAGLGQQRRRRRPRRRGTGRAAYVCVCARLYARVPMYTDNKDIGVSCRSGAAYVAGEGCDRRSRRREGTEREVFAAGLIARRLTSHCVECMFPSCSTDSIKTCISNGVSLASNN